MINYSNVYEVVANNHYFLNIFIGGRGIGKTYSCLSEALDKEIVFYLRRTQTEIDNCCNAASNPYKAININTGRNVNIVAAKDNALIIEKKEDQEILRGYASALSTFGKFRGADFSDVTMIIFDEFINISPVNNLKNEANYFYNLLETVGRNRELEGKEPLKVVLLSNANTLDSGIIRSLSLADSIREMKVNGDKVFKDDLRGIYLELLDNKEVKDMKLKTSLYKLTKGTSFYDMAIDNEFTADYFGDVKKVNYNELQPVCCYGSIYFYKYKGKDMMFCSYRKSNCESYSEQTKIAFKRNYGYMIDYYMSNGLMLYQNYNVKLEVQHIF